MKNSLNKIACGLLLVLSSSQSVLAQQGMGLSITPLSFEMPNNEKRTVAHITNKKGDLLLMKTYAFSWKQEDGYVKDGIAIEPRDVLEDTTDVSYFPENFVIKPNSTQTVRLKLKDGASFKNYRVFFEEIESKVKRETPSINFLTTLSLPLFDYQKEKITPESFSYKFVEKEGVNFIELKNTSNSAKKILKIKIKDNVKDLGYYLLPGVISYVSLESLSISEENFKNKEIVIDTDVGIWTLQ